MKRPVRRELRLSAAEERAQLAAAKRAQRSWSDWARIELGKAAERIEIAGAVARERNDLSLRLQIATDLNVADRIRIDALEAGLREACSMVDACIAMGSWSGIGMEFDRLRKMLPEAP